MWLNVIGHITPISGAQYIMHVIISMMCMVYVFNVKVTLYIFTGTQ